MKFKALSVLVGLSVCLLLSLCSLSANPASAAGKTFWRLVHASPDISSADVYVDGAPLVSNFHYGTVTGYVPTIPGVHKFQVAFVGKGIGAAVVTQDITVYANIPYTVAILGTKSTGYSVLNFLDDNSVVTGMVKVRAYQLSPDAGPVNFAANNGTLANGLPYQQASRYVTVPAGAYTLKATAVQGGTTVPDSTTLQAGTLTSVFTLGLLNGNPKLSVVATQATLIPGMPLTGSDPHALPTTPQPAQPLLPWLWGSLAVVAISGGLLFSRRGHRKIA